MGWGTNFFSKIKIKVTKKLSTFIANVYFHKQTFLNKYEVEDKIKDNLKEIEGNKQKILFMIASTPKNYVGPNDDLLYYPINFFNSLIEEIVELEVENYKLKLYLEYLSQSEIEKYEEEDNNED